jgi:uncharacterized Zn-finger protein
MAKAPSPAETVEVDDANISCDGGGGTLGHPKIYLTAVVGGVDCPYCDKHFALKPVAKLSKRH